ncbi:MAG: NAD(P)-dependent alcohol dehydrogenase [Bacteroidales bacterium]|nr:NAD(P)-dependent alcohol dehydrogenase [Bacteroidales bacterium]MCF8390918.1 NAD(P)-dependent alcohol dehydrogenase [Bacteroidales bacterium]
MKAIICTKYGEPEVLQLKDVEKPIPKSDEILIKIVATSVTASDCIIRSLNLSPLMKIPARMALGFTKPRKPILGMVLSGTIEAVGDKVTLFQTGEKIFAHTYMKFGTYAEYICLPETSAVETIPENYSFEEAAAIPYGGTLALYFLQKAKIQKGQNVLIYGASGAIGTLAVQIAKYYGTMVDGVCSKSNFDLVMELGADLVIDYTNKDFKLEDKKYDLIFDAVGKKKSSDLKYKNALKASGKFISVDDGSPGTKAVCKENLYKLRDLLETKKIKAVIDKIYPMEQIVEGHRYVDKGHKKGNVIIRIGE